MNTFAVAPYLGISKSISFFNFVVYFISTKTRITIVENNFEFMFDELTINGIDYDEFSAIPVTIAVSAGDTCIHIDTDFVCSGSEGGCSLDYDYDGFYDYEWSYNGGPAFTVQVFSG